jgi:hypothetical protein
VTLSFRVVGGGTAASTVIVPAGSRRTVHADAVPGLANKEFATTITSSLPVVAERSMYWAGGPLTWRAAENTPGTPGPAPSWALAEGAAGSPLGFQTFLVIANPSDTSAEVDLTFFGSGGKVLPAPYHVTVPTGGRRVVWVNAEVPAVAGEFGTLVTSVNGVAIVVERSMYWTASGLPFREGSSAMGTVIR